MKKLVFQAAECIKGAENLCSAHESYVAQTESMDAHLIRYGFPLSLFFGSFPGRNSSWAVSRRWNPWIFAKPDPQVRYIMGVLLLIFRQCLHNPIDHIAAGMN